MKISYFPGCTLTNKAKGLNEMGKQCAKILGLELVELDNWYCCQANFSMVTDNLMNHLSAVRTLISAAKTGQKLVVLCSTCYYVLKRINHLMQEDEEKRKTVFDFLEEEYRGPLEIIHFLELIRDEVGFDKVNGKIKVSLENIIVAPYYGCQLLRPSKELAFDDPEAPTIFEQFLKSLGCRTVGYPFKTECCGSFLATSDSEVVEDCVSKILNSAITNGAEAMTTSCPLCSFNLDWSQKNIYMKNNKLKNIPVFYLTELMALAMDIVVTPDIWDEHVIDPRPFLNNRGLLKEISL